MKRNRILSVLASLVMLIQPMQDTAFPVSAYTVWNGTADIAWHDTSDTLEEITEFHISTAEQLAGLAKEVNENGKNFNGETIYLDADIYLNAPGSWTQSWEPIGLTDDTAFYGTFDGQGHSIYGLSYSGDTTNRFIGLFGVSYGTLRNIVIGSSNISIKSNNQVYVGCVVGYSYTPVSHCENHGNITATVSTGYVGGICGKAYLKDYIEHSIESCKNTGEISLSASNSNTYVAGIYGDISGKGASSYVTISNCQNTGTVRGIATSRGMRFSLV